MGTLIAEARGYKFSMSEVYKEIIGVLGLSFLAQQTAIGLYKLGLPFIGGFYGIKVDNLNLLKNDITYFLPNFCYKSYVDENGIKSVLGKSISKEKCGANLVLSSKLGQHCFLKVDTGNKSNFLQ